MLQRLYIQNIALIDNIEVEFEPGFNVLTGETGAGKSILIDAVNLVLGERASRELIKFGEDKAKVEAVFNVSQNKKTQEKLSEMGITCEDGMLFFSREISASGKGVVRINGGLAQLAQLKEISDLLVDVHGQHEHQSLLSPNKHIDFLDQFAAGEVTKLKTELVQKYQEYTALVKESLSGFDSESEREREIDILRYQIREIESAQLLGDEEATLQEERMLLANAEHILTALQTAYSALNEGDASGLGAVGSAMHSLNEIERFSPEYEANAARLREVYYQLEDIAALVRNQRDGLEYNPERLNEVERRIDLITDLKRKYGNSIAEILLFGENADKRLNELVSATARIAQLQTKIDESRLNYFDCAVKLSKARHAAAKTLEKLVLKELADLGLDKAGFAAVFTDSTNDEPKRNGMDDVEFLLSANPGEPLKPLAKVASGGELSRIMLCFKTIFAESDGIDTLIFDEIDSGISGQTAKQVGEKMVRIADARQVICVTHLAQIAALADFHFLVQKTDDGENTTVALQLLDAEGCYRRVSQMMDGTNDSTLAYEHAKNMIIQTKADKASRRAK